MDPLGCWGKSDGRTPENGSDKRKTREARELSTLGTRVPANRPNGIVHTHPVASEYRQTPIKYYLQKTKARAPDNSASKTRNSSSDEAETDSEQYQRC